jgi:hypothetical protein
MLFRSTGPLALSLPPSGGVMKDWRLIAEATLLALLIASAAVMRAEPLISEDSQKSAALQPQRVTGWQR